MRVSLSSFAWMVLAAGLGSCSGNESQPSASGPVPIISRDVLFGNPDRMNPSLSPDGSRFAYIAPLDGVLNVYVANVGESEGTPVTHYKSSPIYEYFWAPDGRYVMFLNDNDGDENYALYSVDTQTGEQRAITTSKNVQVNIVEVNPNYPDRILIEMNERNPLAHDVFSLDIASGAMTMAAENPGNVRFWITDPQLRVRGMHLANQDGSFDFMVRDDESSPWRNVAHWELADAITSRPLGFSADGRLAYLLDSRGAKTGRLCALDLATGDVAVLAEDAEYDLGDVFGVELYRDPATAELQAVRYHKERAAWIPLQDSWKQDLAALAKVRDGDVDVLSRSRDDRTWVVRYEPDTGTSAYYTYERDSGRATLLFEEIPALDGAQLARMEPFTCQARDGLTLHGYIMFPVGAERKNLPMVVNPHGGPWFRDQWGYNPEAQWLANRGYICLNVEFRGSTTYGKDFINAADHEWGRKMLFDVIDAAQWAVDQGYADPHRMGIYGASFGGYQTLCAAAFTPDFFQCAIDCVGPANLITFMNAFPPQWETRKPRFYLRGGHPDRDQDMLRERSPYFHADQIRIPMLVAAGAHDPRVKQAESDAIVAKLEENGIEHEYLLFPDEGHGFAKPENRETFYAAAEAFLAKHLGGRQQESPPVP